MIISVAIDARARRAFGALHGISALAPGTVVQGLGGELVRIREDGGAEPVLPGGHPRPGAAAEPMNTREIQ